METIYQLLCEYYSQQYCEEESNHTTLAIGTITTAFAAMFTVSYYLNHRSSHQTPNNDRNHDLQTLSRYLSQPESEVRTLAMHAESQDQSESEENDNFIGRILSWQSSDSSDESILGSIIQTCGQALTGKRSYTNSDQLAQQEAEVMLENPHQYFKYCKWFKW